LTVSARCQTLVEKASPSTQGARLMKAWVPCAPLNALNGVVIHVVANIPAITCCQPMTCRCRPCRADHPALQSLCLASINHPPSNLNQLDIKLAFFIRLIGQRIIEHLNPIRTLGFRIIFHLRQDPCREVLRLQRFDFEA